MMKTIKAPKGFHFMKSGKGLKLMKHKGKFKAHKGASLTAKLKLIKTHRKSKCNTSFVILYEFL
mgnify:CR=1 FL=1